MYHHKHTLLLTHAAAVVHLLPGNLTGRETPLCPAMEFRCKSKASMSTLNQLKKELTKNTAKSFLYHSLFSNLSVTSKAIAAT